MKRSAASAVGLPGIVVLCLSLMDVSEAAMTVSRDNLSASLNVQECGATGSGYETTAATVAGDRDINVADPGDFSAGQEVIINGAYTESGGRALYGPGSPYEDRRPLRDEVELRGKASVAGSWVVYLLDIDGANPLTFRWSDDLARSWGGMKIPVTFDWQSLNGGMEVRFNKRDLAPGNMISFSTHDQLVTTIEAIRGRVFTLRDAPNRATDMALVRHSDTAALQAAIDRAIKEQRNVFFPAGRYRLTHGLTVRDAASIRIDGAGAETTTIDITDGTGSCFSLDGGTEVTIRNFSMVGHTGMAEQPASFTTSSGHRFWACALKPCNAVSIHGTERVLVENVHASSMASECFYSQGAFRKGTETPAAYTKELTYLRCSVTDCAANAFNNNDMAENTSVLYCRIENVAQEGWHAWEGPSRYIRLIGNYIRNAGPVTIGDLMHRDWRLDELGCGQAIVSGNVFEGIGRAEGIVVAHGPSQVAISDNLFINYTGHAISVMGEETASYPARSVTVTGNNIEMWRDLEEPLYRIGIRVSGASDVIVSDNQVRVPGSYDPHVIGIILDEPSVNLNLHDNLVENCGYGIWARRVGSEVTEVLDARTFRQSILPTEWPTSHLYRDWLVIWLKNDQVQGTSVIEAYDPDKQGLRLTQPRQLRVGDQFEIAPPQGVNWNLHDNTVTGCLNPVLLDAYGSSSSTFARNIISRGGAVGVQQALQLRGRFNVIGNTFSDFDEPGSVVLALYPDRFGKALPNIISGNIIEHCAHDLSESQEGLWKACRVSGNSFTGSDGVGK